MPGISRFYFAMAITYLMIGIGVGLHMSISQDHGAAGAHAHINLLGWVTSAVFGGYYALNPQKAEGWLSRTQCILYSLGLVVMLPALYMMLTGQPGFEPAVAIGSMYQRAAGSPNVAPRPSIEDGRFAAPSTRVYSVSSAL